MAKFIDSLDYQADTFEVAPRRDWKIMSIGTASVTKKQPRYCAAACQDYEPDSDRYCKKVHECTAYVFDTHIIRKDETVFNVLFATNINDPSEGFAWYVGEKYLRDYLGDDAVNRMLREFYDLIKEPEDGIVI